MSLQRIRGEEVEVILIVDGQTVGTLTAVKSFEFSYQLEIKAEGYLGEKTDRKDSVFKGIKGKMAVQLESKDVFNVIQKIIDKAQRRTPGTVINIKAALNFPNGDRVRVIIPRCEFGEIPINFAGRTEYGETSFDFEASNAQTIST
jgi:hypothetical protein